ncbi:MAG: DUF960 domain-containing protein [Oscillospiraceae bacterium]|nr:DUF960 domain-containing protein [Oscillospiraceae bacterium]
MFEPNKPRYLTRGVDNTIPLDVQLCMWNIIDRLAEPKDYLQLFHLSITDGMQVIHHTTEQPLIDKTYTMTTFARPVTAKVYVIDSGEYCTMLLSEEY